MSAMTVDIKGPLDKIILIDFENGNQLLCEHNCAVSSMAHFTSFMSFELPSKSNPMKTNETFH